MSGDIKVVSAGEIEIPVLIIQDALGLFLVWDRAAPHKGPLANKFSRSHLSDASFWLYGSMSHGNHAVFLLELRESGRGSMMTSTNEPDRPESVQQLIAVGDYAWPRSETQQTLRHLLEKLRLNFFPKVSDKSIDKDKLKTVSHDAFEAAVRRALKSTLLASLDDTYLEWASQKANKFSRQLFVYPPMNDDILSEWATTNGLAIIDDKISLSTLSDAPCVVIPRLEHYFTRDHERLGQLFNLFSELSQHKGRVLVGCNSWALRVLKQFDDLRLLLGQGHTFPPFDASALAAILEEGTDDPGAYLSIESGVGVFERDDDGELCDPFLENLVERSLGHPWVAIEMFLRGIAETKDPNQSEAEHRSWVELPEGCSLPKTGIDAPLFALHNLLIHGTRKIEAFNALMPHRVPTGVWSELEQTGFVDIENGYVSCAIRNYPDTRNELSAAGFNLDSL